MKLRRKTDRWFYSSDNSYVEQRLLRKSLVKHLCSLNNVKVSTEYLDTLEARLVQVLVDSCKALRKDNKRMLRAKHIVW